MFDIYLKYCEEIFGGYHKFTKNNLGYDVLNIHNNRDDFKIVLADKVRFGEYTLFHRALDLILMELIAGMSKLNLKV